MKRMTSMCLAALLSGAATGSAQTAQSQESRPNGSVTMVGCLEQGKDGPEYFLIGAAEQSRGAGTRPVGTSGAAGAVNAARLRLVSNGRFDLGDAVNQRVEVSGELVTRGNVRTLNVKNVRSLAPSCTAPLSVK
jgi:hypothetical protein